MSPLRARLRARPLLVLWLAAAALLIELLVPAGYMPAMGRGGAISLELCSGHAAAMPDMPAMAPGRGASGERRRKHAPADRPCPFAGLAAPALAGADPVLLVAATVWAFAFAIAFRPALPRPAPVRLRPPLRGPPTLLG